MRDWKINWTYFVAAAFMAAAIYFVSLALFPQTAQSNRQLIALAAAAVAGALTIAAGVWAGLEKREPPPSPAKPSTVVGGDMVAGDKTVEQQAGGDIVGGDKVTTQTAGGDIINAGVVQITAAQAGVLGLHQLPPPTADFTGRAAELAELRQAVHEQGATISGLRGMGGVGKTALALVLANELAADYPDAQIFLDLQGTSEQPLPPEAVMAHVVRAYKPVEKLPDDPAQLAAAYRSVLHDQKALLVFDNARDAEQLKPLIPPAGCFLLVTSRQHFTLPGLQALDLDQLPPEEATALLLRICPRIGEHAGRLAHLCGYLPLALRLAASALADRHNLGVVVYTRLLEGEQGRLKRLDRVEASLSLSYDLLSPELQALWRALAVFPADFDGPGAAAVWSLEADPASERLGDLLRFSLLEYNLESERYHLHDLARDFALSRLSEAERDEAQRRHAQRYKDVLASAGDLYEKGGDDLRRGLALFDLERANIVAGQAWAAAHTAQDELAAGLANGYPDVGVFVLDLRQHPRERIRWLDAGLAAARQLKDRQMEGDHLGNLGLAYAALGDARRAIEYSEQALVIDRELGDRPGEGAALGNLGIAYAALGDARAALEYYEQALAIDREIREASTERSAEWTAARRAEGVALGNLGIAYADLGDAHRAIAYYEQSLAIDREIGDRRGEGNALGNLGLAYADLGDARRALEYSEQALVIVREIGDRRAEGSALGNLGIAYAALGDARRAIAYYEQSLAIDREIGDRRGEGSALMNTGNAYYHLGEPRQAIGYHEQALPIFREIGDRPGEGKALGNLGTAFSALGDAHRAIECYEQSLAIAREIGDRQGESNASWNLGDEYQKQGELEKAVALMQVRVDYLRELGHPDVEKVAATVEEIRRRLAQADPKGLGNP